MPTPRRRTRRCPARTPAGCGPPARGHRAPSSPRGSNRTIGQASATRPIAATRAARQHDIAGRTYEGPTPATGVALVEIGEARGERGGHRHGDEGRGQQEERETPAEQRDAAAGAVAHHEHAQLQREGGGDLERPPTHRCAATTATVSRPPSAPLAKHRSPARRAAMTGSEVNAATASVVPPASTISSTTLSCRSGRRLPRSRSNAR